MSFLNNLFLMLKINKKIALNFLISTLFMEYMIANLIFEQKNLFNLSIF